MEFLSRVLKGLVVGVANIIPGVSGGTMAVVMGIYDRLIGAVSDLRRDFKILAALSFPYRHRSSAGNCAVQSSDQVFAGRLPNAYKPFLFGIDFRKHPDDLSARQKRVLSKNQPVALCSQLCSHAADDHFPECFGRFQCVDYHPDTPHSHSSAAVGAAVAAACNVIMPGISGSMVMVLLVRLYLGADCHLRPEHPVVASGGCGCAAGHLLWCKGNQLVHEALRTADLFCYPGSDCRLGAADFTQCRFYSRCADYRFLFTLAAGAAIAWWMWQAGELMTQPLGKEK